MGGRFGELRKVDGLPGGTVSFVEATDVFSETPSHVKHHVKLREIGNAVAVRRGSEADVRLFVERESDRLLSGLREHSAPLFQVGETVIVEGPVTDFFGRFRQVGYRMVVGSEQLDYWSSVLGKPPAPRWAVDPSFGRAWLEFKQAVTALVGGWLWRLRRIFKKGM